MENKTHIARVISGKKAGIVYSQHMGSNSLKNLHLTKIKACFVPMK